MSPELTIPVATLNVITKAIRNKKMFGAYSEECAIRTAGVCPDKEKAHPSCNACIYATAAEKRVKAALGNLPSSTELVPVVGMSVTTIHVNFDRLLVAIVLTHSGAMGGRVTLAKL